MTEINKSSKRFPNVDRETAKGKGEGGFGPHPEPKKVDRPAPFDPHAYKPNIDPPPVKLST